MEAKASLSPMVVIHYFGLSYLIQTVKLEAMITDIMKRKRVNQLKLFTRHISFTGKRQENNRHMNYQCRTLVL